MQKTSTKNQLIVFYDGDCGLCEYAIKFLLEKDKEHKLLFSPLQGEYAHSLFKGKDFLDMKTIIVYLAPNAFMRGAAVKLIISNLKSLKSYRWVNLIPTILVDIGYRIIAKYRFVLFGKSDECLYLDEDLKKRFIL